MNESSGDHIQQPERALLYPPKPVQTAFLLWLGAAALPGLFVLIIFIQGLIEISTNRLSGASAPYRLGYLIGFVFVSLLFLSVPAVMIFLAVKMRVGRNWARIALAVIGALVALLTLVMIVVNVAAVRAPVGGYFMVGLVINVGVLAMIGGGLFLMFRPRVGGYFT